MTRDNARPRPRARGPARSRRRAQAGGCAPASRRAAPRGTRAHTRAGTGTQRPHNWLLLSAHTHPGPARPGPRGFFSPLLPSFPPPFFLPKVFLGLPPHRVIQSRCQSPCPPPPLPPAVGSASRGVSPKLYKLSFPPSPLEAVSGRGGREGWWRHQQQRGEAASRGAGGCAVPTP